MATVRIPISAYIRPDISIEPGNIDFGTVDVGVGARQTAHVAYSGRSDWGVRGVTVNHDYLEAQIVETQRSRGYGGEAVVKYDLIVQVKPSAPVGVIRDKIILQTNDASNPTVPVLVEARVEPDIVVSPQTLTLGDVAAGSERKYTVVIKGKKPFAIERIECESDEERFKVMLSRAPKAVHVLPLTFSSPEEPGAFHEEFTITVAGREQPVTFSAVGNIVASTTSTSPGN